MLERIDAATARRRLEAGATLVDIRAPDEFRRQHVPGSHNLPMDRLGVMPLPAGPRVFTCRSGNRTAACAAQLQSLAGASDAILVGGLEAWEAAGGPVERPAGQPLEIMRQVQIAAGSLVLAGVLLGLWLHPGFLGLAAFVGAGLTFAGLSGWCGMARLLALMPWNRQQPA